MLGPSVVLDRARRRFIENSTHSRYPWLLENYDLARRACKQLPKSARLGAVALGRSHAPDNVPDDVWELVRGHIAKLHSSSVAGLPFPRLT